MAKNTIETAGTQLFVIASVTPGATPQILKFACPTGITGMGDTTDQIEDTCLEDNVRSYKKGLSTPGQLSVPFNFIPGTLSHQLLFILKDSGTILPWLVGLSDGKDAPTLNTTQDGFMPPANRTCISFNGHISGLELDIALNEIIRGTLTIQRSGPAIPHFNGPYP